MGNIWAACPKTVWREPDWGYCTVRPRMDDTTRGRKTCQSETNTEKGQRWYNPQLDTFIRVADAGSFNKAAEESYITPTAVIKQINLLEDSLGIKLFERTHRGLTLTEAGKSLYQDTKYIIQYCRDSVTRAKNAMRNNVSVIRIGSSPMTPAQLLMQLWPEIQVRWYISV